MKYLIISDIHGSAKYLKLALQAYDDFKCDKIIILYLKKQNEGKIKL